ncbi:anti-sigma factor [Aureimonas pseudogalii]|uniref:Regulator of SigK n=1 Tax=Aureimonas pseudogalii TaxID=1744844 RepID=A0A7W6MLP4_9HYPH|nr:anti-sigma factor [Aureimonas pseudogalii]MBB4000035.1 anti-sigma-K factor RskA [Aureimonas pseudogalii]
MSATGERDDEALAAEYALGVLSARERRAAERRMREDAAFAAEVDGWTAHLAPLAATLAPVEPPAGLWRAIEAELPHGASAPIAAPAVPGRRLVSALWQWLAVGASAVALASLVGLAVIAQAPTHASPMMTASIAAADGLPLFTAVIDAGTGQAMLVPIRVDAAGGVVPELWLVPAGGTPISLGLLDAARPLRIDLRSGHMDDMGMMSAPDAALAVSMEPAGGSPTGQPTGPVVGQGLLRSV